MSLSRFLLLASALASATPPTEPGPAPGFLNADGSNLPTTAKVLHDAIAVAKIGAEEWAGFPDDLGTVSWSTTTDVTTPAEFQAAMVAAWNGGAGAAQRHRIRMAGSGTWNNVAGVLSGYKAWNGSQWLTANFTGSGGVLITWVGTRPTIQNQISIEAKRIEFRDLRFSRADQASSAGSNDWTMDAGNYGAPSNMPWYYRPLIKFRDCEIGSYWHPTKSALANFADWSNGIQARHFEQIIFVGCKFWRASRAIGAYSCGIVVIRQCDFSEGVQVAINCNEIAATDLDHKSSMADPNQYMLVEQNIDGSMAEIALPSFDFARVTVELEQNYQVNRSAWTGRRRVTALPGIERWLANCQTDPIATEVEDRAWRAFLVGARGPVNQFRLQVACSQTDVGSPASMDA